MNSRGHVLGVPEAHLVSKRQRRPTRRKLRRLRYCRLNEVTDEAIAVIAVVVGRADLHEGDIATDHTLLDQGTHLADMTGNDAQSARGCNRA